MSNKEGEAMGGTRRCICDVFGPGNQRKCHVAHYGDRETYRLTGTGLVAASFCRCSCHRPPAPQEVAAGVEVDGG